MFCSSEPSCFPKSDVVSNKALFWKTSKDAFGHRPKFEKHRQEFVWQRRKPFKAHISSTGTCPLQRCFQGIEHSSGKDTDHTSGRNAKSKSLGFHKDLRCAVFSNIHHMTRSRGLPSLWWPLFIRRLMRRSSPLRKERVGLLSQEKPSHLLDLIS